MQISGAGHCFLEGWIGDHSVEFLVDSGSSVTAMSNSFYQTLVHAGAPLGMLEHAARTLRSANGTGIKVSGKYVLLCGIVHGITDEIPHNNLQPCDGN